ncbi:zinc ribbon domain-containing protein YjdM [Pontibacter saemangeumensis]
MILMEVKDSNGNILSEGDAVTLTKDLKVKGSSITLKRGKVVKNIRLTNNPEEIDCRIDGSNIVLKTSFLKKA